MRFIWDLVVILSALIWILALILQDYISPSFGFFALLMIVFFRALGRAVGGNIGRLIRILFKIGLPLASIGTLLVMYSGGGYREIATMLGGILTLCFIFIVFYFFFYGLISSCKR